MAVDKFEQILTALVDQVSGGAIAAMLGMDGVGVHVALAEAWKESDREVLEVELAELADGVQRTARELGEGESPTFFLGTPEINFLGTMVDAAYFVVLGVEPGGDLAQAEEALVAAREALGDWDAP